MEFFILFLIILCIALFYLMVKSFIRIILSFLRRLFNFRVSVEFVKEKRTSQSESSKSKRGKAKKVKTNPDLFTEQKSYKLLRKASEYKKIKDYENACATLREAFDAETPQYPIPIKDRLRLPMYLQLAGKNDEGWLEISNLLLAHQNNIFDQIAIHNQMRIFLQKEKKHKEAILYGVWTILLESEADYLNIQGIKVRADEDAELSKLPVNKEFAWLDEGRDIQGYTDNKNPIYDVSYSFLSERYRERKTKGFLLEKVAPMLKRAKLTEREYNLNAGLYAYINSRHVAFDFLETRKMVKDCLLLE